MSLAELLEASARRAPGRTSLVAPSGRELTYGELDARASRLAAFLRASGVRPGDRVGFCLRKGLASVTVLLGALKARAAYVPLDVQSPAERNAAILRDCEVAALFVGDEHASLLAAFGAAPARLAVPVVRVADPDDELPDALTVARSLVPLAPEPAARRPDDLACILYTSGSTGMPKGVMLTHGNVLAFVDWCSELFAPRADDRFSGHAPFHFDLSLFDLLVALKHGATLHLVGEELARDPRALARFAAARKLTIWYSTPSVLALMAERGGLAELDLAALRHVLFAGEVFPVKQLRQLTRLLPRPAYWNLYGPTETNVCTYARIPLPVPDERSTPYPIGALCSHCDGLVLAESATDGEQLAPAAEGLLWIAGPSLFQGYWNRPDLDAKVFLQRDGRRWYNTGDVVRRDPQEGLVYVGRKDRMVKRRGYRIELGEIEAALLRNPGLREAAVVASTDAESGVVIHAHVASAGGRLSLVELKRFCTTALPPYMSPDRFVVHAALPRTSTAKIDYQALLRRGA